MTNCTISANMTKEQCRMARAGLKWSLDKLAEESGVARRSIAAFEAGSNVRSDTVSSLALTLVGAGVAFLETDHGRGVLIKV